MPDSNILLILAACSLFFAWIINPVLQENQEEKQHHDLIIKCMEKDTPTNCALIFKKDKSK